MGKFAAFGRAAARRTSGELYIGEGVELFICSRAVLGLAGCGSIVRDSGVILRNWVWW